MPDQCNGTTEKVLKFSLFLAFLSFRAQDVGTYAGRAGGPEGFEQVKRDDMMQTSTIDDRTPLECD
jgi:hypothetical protein